jgi:hypothetical protein
VQAGQAAACRRNRRRVPDATSIRRALLALIGLDAGVVNDVAVWRSLRLSGPDARSDPGGCARTVNPGLKT